MNKHQVYINKIIDRSKQRAAGRRVDRSAEWRQEYAASLRSDVTEYVSAGMSTGSCSRVEEKVYTGTKLIGIATSHKSNLIPIFNSDDAKSVSSMRR